MRQPRSRDAVICHGKPRHIAAAFQSELFHATAVAADNSRLRTHHICKVMLPQENPVPESSLYSATKGAIDTLTMALAKELGPRNIRVNTVAPGLVDTEGNRESGFVDSAAGNAGAAATPLGPRFGKPEEIAPVVVFLASDDAAWLTGERISASGGLH
jgi:NAD(P)-dependent dehydrogenase (short-subunit alcohol dehydrogenase family)